MNPEFKMSLILAGLGAINGIMFLSSGDWVNLVAQLVCTGTAVYFFYLGLTYIDESDNINKKDK